MLAATKIKTTRHPSDANIVPQEPSLIVPTRRAKFARTASTSSKVMCRTQSAIPVVLGATRPTHRHRVKTVTPANSKSSTKAQSILASSVLPGENLTQQLPRARHVPRGNSRTRTVKLLLFCANFVLPGFNSRGQNPRAQIAVLVNCTRENIRMKTMSPALSANFAQPAGGLALLKPRARCATGGNFKTKTKASRPSSVSIARPDGGSTL